MKVSELIAHLSTMNPDAEIRVLSSHDKGDDITDWNITRVHDHFTIREPRDMAAIEIDFDQRPEYVI